MRGFLICLSLALPLTACGLDTKEENRKIALKEISCMREKNKLDQYHLVENCTALQPSRHFAGTYFYGFERSVFAENYSKEPANLDKSGNYFDLVVPEYMKETVFHTEEGHYSAFYVEFIGRESDIPGSAGKPTILFDKVLKVKRVSQKN